MQPDRSSVPTGQPAAIAERLCAVLGHELRNPLAAALTGVAVAAEMTDADDPRRVFLDRAGHDMERVSALLEGWLALARNRRRGGGDRFLVDSVLRTTAERLGIDFGTESEDGPGGVACVEGHAGLLERAVENLVVNARAAGAKTVSVRVRLPGDRRHVIVDVDDDGPGVPEHLRGGRLFEEFVTDSGPGGTGLGLAIVRDVAESFGGHVEVGEKPTPGARFRLVLPRVDAAAPDEGIPSHDEIAVG